MTLSNINTTTTSSTFHHSHRNTQASSLFTAILKRDEQSIQTCISSKIPASNYGEFLDSLPKLLGSLRLCHQIPDKSTYQIAQFLRKTVLQICFENPPLLKQKATLIKPMLELTCTALIDHAAFIELHLLQELLSEKYLDSFLDVNLFLHAQIDYAQQNKLLGSSESEKVRQAGEIIFKRFKPAPPSLEEKLNAMKNQFTQELSQLDASFSNVKQTASTIIAIYKREQVNPSSSFTLSLFNALMAPHIPLSLLKVRTSESVTQQMTYPSASTFDLASEQALTKTLDALSEAAFNKASGKRKVATENKPTKELSTKRRRTESDTSNHSNHPIAQEKQAPRNVIDLTSSLTSSLPELEEYTSSPEPLQDNAMERMTEQQLYVKAIELNPAAKHVYLKLAKCILPNESVTIASKSRSQNQLLLQTLNLNPPDNELDAEAYFMLAESLKSGDMIKLPRDKGIANDRKLLLEAIKLSPFRADLYQKLASILNENESVEFSSGRSMNRQQLEAFANSL